MKYTVHKSSSRGQAHHDWLNSFHTFSFGSYYNPQMMNFGALRVINEDTVQPEKGFGTHPHNDMEIITIPLSGTLEHKDSMGNIGQITAGEVQAMSAGTGILHSEYNASSRQIVHFLQIWVETKEKGINPNYSQKKFDQSDFINQWKNVVAPAWDQDTESVIINQDAYFSLGKFDAGQEIEYALKNPEKNGVYVFLIEGGLEFEGEKIEEKDGVAIEDISEIKMQGKADSFLLVMEVPI